MKTHVKYFMSSVKEKWRMQDAGAGVVLNYHKNAVAHKNHLCNGPIWKFN